MITMILLYVFPCFNCMCVFLYCFGFCSAAVFLPGIRGCIAALHVRWSLVSFDLEHAWKWTHNSFLLSFRRMQVFMRMRNVLFLFLFFFLFYDFFNGFSPFSFLFFLYWFISFLFSSSSLVPVPMRVALHFHIWTSQLNMMGQHHQHIFDQIRFLLQVWFHGDGVTFIFCHKPSNISLRKFSQHLSGAKAAHIATPAPDLYYPIFSRITSRPHLFPKEF